MSKKLDFGTIEKKSYELAEIEWRIENCLFDHDCYFYESPSFIFANSSWCLGLKLPDRVFEYQYMEYGCDLYLTTEKQHKYSVDYNFTVKKKDNTDEFSKKGIINEDEMRSEIPLAEARFMRRRRKGDFFPLGIKSVICTLKRENTHSNQPMILQDKSPSKLISLEKLSENFRNLFGDKETSDTTLEVKDQVYKVHRCVLIARSTIFSSTFKHDTLEKQTGVITIPDCDPGSFEKFLEYLYCGKIEDLSSRDALNLYYTSDKYEVLELKEFCVESLMQSLTVESLCDVAILAEKYEKKKLFSAVQEFFNKNACEVLDTSDWEDLTKNFYRLSNKILKEKMKL